MKLRIGLALMALLLATGCGTRGGPPQGGPVPVVAVRAAEQPLHDELALVGSLEAFDAVDIKSELDGPVAAIVFTEGQAVEAGAVLVRIDPRKLAAAVAEAEARQQLADATLTRYDALTSSQAIAQQELDQARTNAAALRASADFLRAQLDDATITAPFAGVVGARLVSPGQFVTKGQTLTALIDADPMQAVFHVPERFLNQTQVGQPITLTVAAFPDDVFRGAVAFIAPAIDPITRTALLKASVPNQDGRLRPGMFADLKLTLQVREQAVLIPESAVLLQGDATSVFVVDAQGQAQPQPVATGLRTAGLVEITSGLAAGDTVVIEGTQKLRPGATAAVRLDERPLAEIGAEAAAALPVTVE